MRLLSHSQRSPVLPTMIRPLPFLIWIGLAASAAFPAWALDNSDCFACHGQQGATPHDVDEAAFKKSIHGKNLCVSCHADVTELPHAEKLASVACNRCHRVETQIYVNSDHGRAVARGRSEAATCKDCHGHSHTLLNSRDPSSPVNRRNIPQTCAHCHDNKEIMGKAKLTERDPFQSYSHTVHGEAFAKGQLNAAVCSDCHGTHDLHGGFNPASRISKQNIPETCGKCHQNVAAVYRVSIHGQANKAGIKEAPVCTDCHGEHTIQSPRDPASTVWAGAVTKTCTGCHASERIAMKFGMPVDRIKTYMDTYHGLASQRGDVRVANCASCHGYHDVLPSNDVRSSIYPTNLANTCGRCHPGAAEVLSRGYIHSPPSARHWVIALARRFYLILIPLVLGFMLLHNLLDFLRKLITPAPPLEIREDEPIRLTVNERWQHVVLILTFTVLAYSGFALKFHDATWAQVLAPFGENIRRALHRWTALIFCLLGVYHMIYMVGTRRGRMLLRAFLPSLADLRAMREQGAYSLGLRKDPPPAHGFYHYGEKMEYWSLLWGSLVMVVTGCLLVFNNFALKHFPLWISELATLVHYLEAILACLAILIWHGYAVVFDPRVYPMNWAWLTGFIRRKKSDHTTGKK